MLVESSLGHAAPWVPASGTSDGEPFPAEYLLVESVLL